MQEDLHTRRKREKTGRPLSQRPTRCREKTTHIRQNQWRAILIFPDHSHHNMTICGRQNLKQKIYLSTGHILSPWKQQTPLIPLIHSQIHITLFPPMAKPLYTHKSQQHPQFLYWLQRRANARTISFPHLSQW